MMRNIKTWLCYVSGISCVVFLGEERGGSYFVFLEFSVEE